MSEFLCFIEHFKQFDPQYQTYLSQLQENEDKCIKNIHSRISQPTESLLNHCYSDKLEFEKGLKYESQNFINVKKKHLTY